MEQQIIPVTIQSPSTAPRARAAQHNSSSNSNSSRPASLSLRSLLPSTMPTSKKSSSSLKRPNRLTTHLQRFICGCGLFYLVVVWYSGVWSTLSLSSIASSSSRSTLSSADTISSESAVLQQVPPQETIAHGRIAMEAEPQESTSQPPESHIPPLEPATPLRIRTQNEEDDPKHVEGHVTTQKPAVNDVLQEPTAEPETLPRASTVLNALADSPDQKPDVVVPTEAPASPIEDLLANAVATTTSPPPLSQNPNVIDLLAPLDLPEELKKLLDPKQPVAPEQTAESHRMSPKEAFHARQKLASAQPSGIAAAFTPEKLAELTPEQLTRVELMDKYAQAAKRRAEGHGTETPVPVDPKVAAAVRVAEEHALTVKQMPKGETKKRRLKCIGWRATEGCDPDGKRLPSGDRTCVRFVEPTASGYCEVEDRDTGERFRVMKRHCNSVHRDSRFRCFESWDFSNFAIAANTALENAQASLVAAPAPASEATTSAPKNGILIVIYPKLIPSAYAIVRTLRAQNCKLPIEFWYRRDELSLRHPTLELIEDQYGPVVFRAIHDQRATGFATKISAIMNSDFDNILFLDADNFPVKDPTYLFELPEYKTYGAIFWPDFWHPGHTIFNIHETSLLWQLVDMPFVDMFEQESGQLLINKKRNALALELMQFYTFHRPNHFEKFRLAHGDKDLFRLAWLKTNTPFHFIKYPPGVAGKLQNETFCGMTMVQRDPRGDVLFLHRNAKKLTGRKFNYNKDEVVPNAVNEKQDTAGTRLKDKFAKFVPKVTMETDDPAVWSHMLLFKPTSKRSDFVIDIFEGAPDFPAGQWCYGKRNLAAPHFNVLEFDKLPYAELETQIIAYAVAASEMARPTLQPKPQQ
ncbi:Pantothenate synthetase, partial [Globisporangium splendens]